MCTHLVSPTSAGLFRRAIAQSFSCAGDLATKAPAEASGSRFAEQLGCPDPATAAACLRAKQPADLLASWQGGSPVVGGRELPLQPSEAFGSDRFHHMPLLLGNTLDEARLFVSLLYREGNPVTPEEYVQVIRT